jgi:hypothetical protein
LKSIIIAILSGTSVAVIIDMVSVRHASVRVLAATLLLLAMCALSLSDAGVRECPTDPDQNRVIRDDSLARR